MALDRLNQWRENLQSQKKGPDAPEPSSRTPESRTSPAMITAPGAFVYTQYNVGSPPPKPVEGKWTRFVCISDTHEFEFPVPDGDVLIHSGDLTHTGAEEGVRAAAAWISSLPHPHKIVIAGNHDLTFHTDWYPENWSRWHYRVPEDMHAAKNHFTNDRARQANITYLEDNTCEVQAMPDGKTWSFYGSPWQPEFFNWAFNYKRGEQAKQIVDKFPKVDVLITHGPPHGILDETDMNMLVGCEALADRLPTLRPRLHVFGHIHEAHGVEIREWTVGDNVERTIFVNAANWPQGKLIAPHQTFGAGAFMPVIVDLLED